MVLTCTTRNGATLTTVTGTTWLSSAHTWVMPTFSPTIAFDAIAAGLSHRAVVHANAPLGQAGRSVDFGWAAWSPSFVEGGPAQTSVAQWSGQGQRPISGRFARTAKVTG